MTNKLYSSPSDYVLVEEAWSPGWKPYKEVYYLPPSREADDALLMKDIPEYKYKIIRRLTGSEVLVYLRGAVADRQLK